jgi:hypothetical protein
MDVRAAGPLGHEAFGIVEREGTRCLYQIAGVFARVDGGPHGGVDGEIEGDGLGLVRGAF